MECVFLQTDNICLKAYHITVNKAASINCICDIRNAHQGFNKLCVKSCPLTL